MKHFQQIKHLVKQCIYCSIATINKDGHPHIAPIGSVYLSDEQGGYFIEMFTSSMTTRNSEQDKACIMAINTSPWFWIKSLFKGKFVSIPGFRLRVTLHEKRVAEDFEKERFLKQVHPLRFFKGHKILWSKMGAIREFTIDEVIPLKMGQMTKDIET